MYPIYPITVIVGGAILGTTLDAAIGMQWPSIYGQIIHKLYYMTLGVVIFYWCC